MLKKSPVNNSLVLYKIRPARVLSVSDKIEIEFEDHKTKRVRDKDIKLIHPGPFGAFDELAPLEGEVDDAWQLVGDGETDLEELSELIHGEYSPATAWATWQLVVDGLLFEGSPERISARSEAQVAADRSQREAKAREEREWGEFVQRLERQQILPEDRERLSEVERLAWGQTKGSQILKALGHQESPENAHRLMVQVGCWEHSYNPHPHRIGVSLLASETQIPELPREERRDLTHLPAFAIDDEGNQDPDDALSLEGDRLWVHVADVAALVPPDSELDLEARGRGANLYLPDSVVSMLPWGVTECLGLGLSSTSPALSIGFRLTPEGRVSDVEVVRSSVRVTRLSYGQVDEQLQESPFKQLLEFCRRFRERRQQAGAVHIDLPEVSVRVVDGEVVIRPLSRLGSREMVAEAMLMAGEAVACYAHEREIAIPFVNQPAPEPLLQLAAGMASMYAGRRCLKPSKSRCKPAPHAGLGLEYYSRVTSPLRRYLDLVTHQQLRRHLQGLDPFPEGDVAKRVAAVESAAGSIRRTERLSNQHWKLVYLRQNSGWRGDGVVVEMVEKKATVIIPSLAMEAKIRLKQEVELDTELQLAVREVDLIDQIAWFRVL